MAELTENLNADLEEVSRLLDNLVSRMMLITRNPLFTSDFDFVKSSCLTSENFSVLDDISNIINEQQERFTKQCLSIEARLVLSEGVYEAAEWSELSSDTMTEILLTTLADMKKDVPQEERDRFSQEYEKFANQRQAILSLETESDR